MVKLGRVVTLLCRDVVHLAFQTKLHVVHAGTGWEGNLLVEFGQLLSKDLWAVLDHELDERRHFVFDDVEARVWPQEAGCKADGEVDGVHAVDLLLGGNVVEQGHYVVQEELILRWNLAQDSGGKGEVYMLSAYVHQGWISFCTCTYWLL